MKLPLQGGSVFIRYRMNLEIALGQIDADPDKFVHGRSSCLHPQRMGQDFPQGVLADCGIGLMTVKKVTPCGLAPLKVLKPLSPTSRRSPRPKRSLS
jgi:hypothetical protein